MAFEFLQDFLSAMLPMAGFLCFLLLSNEKKSSRVYHLITGMAICAILVALEHALSSWLSGYSSVWLSVMIVLNVLIWSIVFKLHNKTNQRRREKFVANLADSLSTHVKGMLLITDSYGNIVNVNEKVAQTLGYQTKELIRQSINKILEPYDNTWTKEEHTYVLNFSNDQHQNGAINCNMRCKDGSFIPAQLNKESIESEFGNFVLYSLNQRKLTGWDSETQESTEAASLVKSAYHDFAPVIFLALDRTGKVQMINQHAISLLGYQSEDVLKKNWFDNFVPQGNRNEFIDQFKKCVATEETRFFRSAICEHNGSERLIQWKFGVELRTGWVLCSGEDITEREAAHQELVNSLNNLSKLKAELEERVSERTKELENINISLEMHIDERRLIEDQLINSQRLHDVMAHNFPNGLIAVLDRHFNFLLVDGQELSVLGLSKELLISNSIFRKPHALVDENAIPYFERAFDSHTTTFEAIRGSSCYQVTAVPLPDSQGIVDEILVVMYNITENKRLQESLYNTIAQEKRLNELKSRFVTMASHEFRTPLSTILSSVFLMESYSGELYEEKKYVHISRIKRTVNILTEILNDFLRLSKLDEGMIEMILSEVNLQEQISEVLKELQPVTRKGQRVSYHHSGLQLGILLDKNLLRSILMNLLSNAIKYSPEGDEIELSTVVSDHDMLINVTDHGIGIAPEERKHIFQRFFRALNAVNIEGTGLGLHIVKRYVELMRGTIDFVSQGGQTTFSVKIPLQFTNDNTRLILR
jgi:PAS domain S-box-containing protein